MQANDRANVTTGKGGSHRSRARECVERLARGGEQSEAHTNQQDARDRSRPEEPSHQSCNQRTREESDGRQLQHDIPCLVARLSNDHHQRGADERRDRHPQVAEVGAGLNGANQCEDKRYGREENREEENPGLSRAACHLFAE